MAATLSGRPAKTEPRYHDAGHCLPAAGNRPWRRLQSDAAPIDDLDRGVRNGRNDCTAARAQDQTRLAPRSRMAWANPHGLRYRRRLRVPGHEVRPIDSCKARYQAPLAGKIKKTSIAQRTASTTLRNSMIEPSPVRLTTRP